MGLYRIFQIAVLVFISIVVLYLFFTLATGIKI
jgi:hypothetical protein